MTGPPLTNTRKWLITFSVMPLTIMQVLDSSATKDLLRQPADRAPGLPARERAPARLADRAESAADGSRRAREGYDALTSGLVLGPGGLGQTVEQAQVLTYVELFLMLSAIFTMSIALLPFMRRVRTDPAPRVEPAIKPLPAPVD